MTKKNIKLKVFVIIFFVVFLIEIITGILITKDQSNMMLIRICMSCFEIAAMLLIIKIWGYGPGSIGLHEKKIISGIKKGLIWSFGFGIIVFLICALLYFISGINPLKLIHTNLPSQPIQVFLYLFAGIIVGPIAEEIFFRGIIFGFLRQLGFLVAIIFSTGFFVLVHKTGSSIPVPQIVGGILFALAYEKERNLLTPITIHALGNAAIFTIF